MQTALMVIENATVDQDEDDEDEVADEDEDEAGGNIVTEPYDTRVEP